MNYLKHGGKLVSIGRNLTEELETQKRHFNRYKGQKATSITAATVGNQIRFDLGQT